MLRPYEDPKILAAIHDLIFEVGEITDLHTGQPREDLILTSIYDAYECRGTVTIPMDWFDRVMLSYRVLQMRRRDWMDERLGDD